MKLDEALNRVSQSTVPTAGQCAQDQRIATAARTLIFTMDRELEEGPQKDAAIRFAVQAYEAARIAIYPQTLWPQAKTRRSYTKQFDDERAIVTWLEPTLPFVTPLEWEKDEGDHLA